jgi:hypothetical protein
MRRILAAVALSAALVGTAACTDTAGSPSGGSSASPGAGATASPIGTGPATDKVVCDDTERLTNDSGRRIGEEIVTAAKSSSTVAEGETKALAAIKTVLNDWASGLRAQANRTSNADLKSALLEYATAVEKYVGQVTRTADLANLQDLNSPEISAATDKLDKICRG